MPDDDHRRRELLQRLYTTAINLKNDSRCLLDAVDDLHDVVMALVRLEPSEERRRHDERGGSDR